MVRVRSRSADRGQRMGCKRVLAIVFTSALRALIVGCIAGQDHQLVEIVRPFRVVDEVELANPFLGGFDAPHPQFLDIDHDGDLDLFVQETIGDVMFFENTGSASSPRLSFRSFRFEDLDVGGWFFFVDLDGDQDEDLLAGQSFSLIKAYRNVGTPADPDFASWADTVRDNTGAPILAEPLTVPFALDVDCNGIVDLMIGDPAGTIARYELSSDPGQPPVFDLIDATYQDILVVGGSVKRGSREGARHGASATAFADVDGDNDPDLLWGDFFEPNVILFRNEGSCSNASMSRVTDSFMAVDGITLDTSGLNMPRPVDIDDDSDMDLFVGVLGGAFVPSSTSIDNFYFLEATPIGFLLETRRFIRTIDVGSIAVPLLADLDGDNDPDMLVANTIDPHELTRGSITMYRNVGGAATPSYILEDTDFLGFDGGFSPAPAIADIDADGDADIFIGRFDGEISWYENTGTALEPDWLLRTQSFLGVDVGSDSFPTFGDLDGDGDLDLLVGESSGTINLFRNVGSAESPVLSQETDNYAAIDVDGSSRPRLVDYDSDGDLDLFVGSAGGSVFFYRNEGDARVARFVEGDALATRFTRTVSPAASDVDGDGDADLVIGTPSGGLTYYRNEVIPTGTERGGPSEGTFAISGVYPNPASDYVTVELDVGTGTESGHPRPSVEVIDVLGRVVLAIPAAGLLGTGRNRLAVDVASLVPGLYLVRLTGGSVRIHAVPLVVL